VRKCAIAALAAALTGCVKYHPRPLDPPRSEHQFRARTLADPGLVAFLKRADWPPAKPSATTEKKMANRLIIAIFGALLFAVHPVHVEAVTWLAARKEVLQGFFFFLGFYIHSWTYK
jgi:hypothetical protein